MQQTSTTINKNSPSSDIFQDEEQKQLWEHQIGENFASFSDVQKVGNKKISVNVQFSSLGGLKVLEVYLGPCKVFRDLKTVKNDTRQDLICQVLVLSGSCDLVFGGDKIRLKNGEIVLIDTTKPMQFEVKKNLHCLIIYMPLVLIHDWIPRIWDNLETRLIKTNTTQGSLLKSYMQLIQKHSEINRKEVPKKKGSKRAFVPLIVANMSMLVYALIHINKSRPKTAREMQLDAAKYHILIHLSDADVSPKTISKELGFSIRYLHWLFHQEKETVSQYIMRKRIEQAQALLGSSADSFFSITEIAFMCGFNDSTHFSRRFKQRVGLPPSKYRYDRYRNK